MSNYEGEEDNEDKSYGLQLDSEIEARLQPTTPPPEGMRYVADTRQQSINPSIGGILSHTTTEDTRCNVRTRGYLPIENYAIIGNMRTVALCGTDGAIDFCCYPKFDSPSIFCRLLDKDKGGHFSIAPKTHTSNKQQYLPNGNILTTRFLSDDGVAQITDYMHVPEQSQRLSTKPLLPWIIRTVQVIRGVVPFRMECFPAFNYAQDPHTVSIEKESSDHERDAAPKLYPEDEISYYVARERVIFKSKDLSMDLRYVVKCGDFACPLLDVQVDERATEMAWKGPGVFSEFELQETQEVTFIFREVPSAAPAEETQLQAKYRKARDPPLTASLLDALFRQTAKYWQNWISQSSYRGRWREHVMRSALTLKLLTYEPLCLSCVDPAVHIRTDPSCLFSRPVPLLPPLRLACRKVIHSHFSFYPCTYRAQKSFSFPAFSYWRNSQLGLSLCLDTRLILHHLCFLTTRSHARGREIYEFH